MRSLWSIWTVFCLILHRTHGITMGNWWNLGLLSWRHPSNSRAFLLAPRPVCMRVHGLSQSQTQLCHRFIDHMPVVSIGAKIGIKECQRQFKYRPWNCTSPHDGSAFGPAIKKGTREAGFAHAISAAGVVHAMARSCRDARLDRCGCSRSSRPRRLHRDWLWGGCGDNLEYAYRFARWFIDVREKEKSYPRGSPQLARMLMNLHNNKAGRMAVFTMATVACKCHGVSGSCSLRTCWKQLSNFGQVGEFLSRHYDSAAEVKFNRRGTKLRKVRTSPGKNSGRRRPTKEDLVFLETSPNFCSEDRKLGLPGTRGRVCKTGLVGETNRTLDNCAEMCCRRGARQLTRETREPCQCRFQWCCQVQCHTCIRLEQVHVCN